jgi:hypothetical protein
MRVWYFARLLSWKTGRLNCKNKLQKRPGTHRETVVAMPAKVRETAVFVAEYAR